MKKHIIYVPKIGDHIDDNAFGGYIVTEEYQKRLIERARRNWKKTIECPKRLSCRVVKKNEISEMEYYYETNPYYGWKPSQLVIKEYE